MDLSILIPSRNELFLKNTIEDILKNIEADTEVIAVLDGQWAEPAIPQHERVNIIYVPEAIGQRAATNLACKLSKARFVMKVDAHCSFDKGFDRKMIEGFKEVGDNIAMVPIMRNLWAFDWKCYKCGSRWYQGPTPIRCMRYDAKSRKIVPNENCNETKNIKRKMIWVGKERPQSTSYCFDNTPHFQYNESYKHTSMYKNDVIVGYRLSFDKPSLPPSVIDFLTDFASSHHLSGSTYHFWGGEDMTVDAMSFSSINNSGGIGTSKVLGVGNKLKMEGVTTSPILTEMVKNGDPLTSSLGQRSNQPSIGNTMSQLFSSEVSTPTITPNINPLHPIPTTGSKINSNTINKLNSILGGEFVYNEKTSSFHNGSVTLKPMYVKYFTETMSLQGSCFMCTREKYLELNLCDESLGSWGNQGIEVACRIWLSGGKVIVNHKTWYAHMFRTQGGDFSFPYPQSGKEVQETKNKVKDLFWDKKWDKQKYPISWLVNRFAPVPGWDNQIKT